MSLPPLARQLLLGIGLAVLASQASAAQVLRDLRLEATGAESARITLSLNAPVNQKVFRLENPERLVIDLPGTRLASGVRMPSAAGPVVSMRNGLQPKQTLRLVVQLRPGVASAVRRGSGSQLIVELGKPVPMAQSSAASVAAAAPTPVPTPTASSTPAAVEAQHAPEDSGRDVIVAIDAGHGGQDPGASGKAGTREKDVVLAIARSLARRINAEPGMRAVLTRDEDRFIPLRERIGIARSARADLFVSIHADAIRNRAVSGSSVYVLSERGASSEAARWLADQENAADLKGGVSLDDKSDQLASVLMDLSQTASIGASMEAAQRVLASLDQVGTIRKTQVQQAGFVVLKSPDIPSMLIETAYISNPAEEKKLRSAAYQKELAEAIFRGVREHFRRSPPDGSLIARQQKRQGAAPVIAGR